MSGLSVVILRPDFAVLGKGSKKEKEKNESVKIASEWPTTDVRRLTPQLDPDALALAQALEQKLCNTPDAGSNHLGCRWQFYE